MRPGVRILAGKRLAGNLPEGVEKFAECHKVKIVFAQGIQLLHRLKNTLRQDIEVHSPMENLRIIHGVKIGAERLKTLLLFRGLPAGKGAAQIRVVPRAVCGD